MSVPGFKYKRVFVSSRDAANPNATPSNFIIQQTTQFSQVHRVGACDFVINNSLHNIPAGKNTLTFTKNGAAQTVTLDAGYYDPDTLLAELNTQMTAAHAVTWTLDLETRAFFADYAGAGTAVITSGSTMLDILGMNVGAVADGSDVWATDTTNNKTWNLAGPQEIFLLADSMGINGNVSNRDVHKRELPILSRILVDVPNGEVINGEEA